MTGHECRLEHRCRNRHLPLAMARRPRMATSSCSIDASPVRAAACSPVIFQSSGISVMGTGLARGRFQGGIARCHCLGQAFICREDLFNLSFKTGNLAVRHAFEAFVHDREHSADPSFSCAFICARRRGFRCGRARPASGLNAMKPAMSLASIRFVLARVPPGGLEGLDLSWRQ